MERLLATAEGSTDLVYLKATEDGRLLVSGGVGGGSSADPNSLTAAQLTAAGLALDATVQATNTALGTDGASPPSIAGTGVRGWLRGIYEKISGTITVGGTVTANTGLSQPLTDTQLRANAVPVSQNYSTGLGVIDANTQRVTLAIDGPAATSLQSITAGIGAPVDVAATTDTGAFGLVSLFKRGLANWTTLLTRIPAQSIAGLIPVDTLAAPSASRVQLTSGTAANILLTPACRRVSMYATQGAWYSITGAATAASHYIAAGERLDFDVPASTTISVLQESVAGSIRITEMI